MDKPNIVEMKGDTMENSLRGYPFMSYVVQFRSEK